MGSCYQLVVLLGLFRCLGAECSDACTRKGADPLDRLFKMNRKRHVPSGGAKTATVASRDPVLGSSSGMGHGPGSLAVFPTAVVVEKSDSLHITLADRRERRLSHASDSVLESLATFDFYDNNLHMYFQRSERNGISGQAYELVSQDTIEDVTFKTRKVGKHYEVGVYSCNCIEVFRFRIIDPTVVSFFGNSPYRTHAFASKFIL